MVEDKDVEGLRRGDRVCFENIFNRYSPDLYVVAYRITGNKAVAEDVVQDFFVKLWMNREKVLIYKSFPLLLFFSNTLCFIKCDKDEIQGYGII